MTARRILLLLLGIVAAAAAVLSFAALRDLALTCGFAASLGWLLPVVVDAGAAAGSLVWLGGRVAEPARRFARVLALALLGLSVAANALGHGLEAFRVPPAWWVVVIVSAIAPAVLGAVVHLAVLVGRTEPSVDEGDNGRQEPVDYELTVEAFGADALDEHGLSRLWDDAPPASEAGRAAALIAAGAGRRRLSRELDITEYEARQLLVATRATKRDIAAGRAADPIDPPPAELRPAVPVLNGVLS